MSERQRHPREYFELREKSRWLALLWAVGEIGHYGGLVGSIMVPLVVIAETINAHNQETPCGWSLGQGLLIALACFVVLLPTSYFSPYLKAYAEEKGRTISPTPDESDGPSDQQPKG